LIVQEAGDQLEQPTESQLIALITARKSVRTLVRFRCSAYRRHPLVLLGKSL